MGATINSDSTTALERILAEATLGSKCIVLAPNLRPDSAVVKTQKSVKLTWWIFN